MNEGGPNLLAYIDNKRFVSIGCPGRPFVTADPRLDDLLPGDDAAFDLGVSYSGVLSPYLISTWISVFQFAAADSQSDD